MPGSRSSDTAGAIATLARLEPERVIGCGAPLVAVWVHEPIHAEVDALPQHAVAMHLGGSTQVEKRVSGRTVGHRTRVGSLSLVAAGERSEWRLGGRMRVAHLYVEPARLATAARRADRLSARLRDFFDARDEGLSSLIRWLLAEGDALDELAHDQAQTLVERHLVRGYLEDAPARPDPNRPVKLTGAALHRIFNLVEERLDGPLRLAELGACVHLSPDHFLRVFREAVGTTPHRFVLERRIDRAQHLLDRTALPAAEVARRCGFRSASHFGAAFRRRVGVTPAMWRAARRR